MQTPNDSREKRLQELGEKLKDLTPEQLEEAIRVAAKLMAAKAKNKATPKA